VLLEDVMSAFGFVQEKEGKKKRGFNVHQPGG
jgi:hypothetical protein